MDERQKVWSQFLRTRPELADPNSQERKLAEREYHRYSMEVEDGDIDYRAACEAAVDEAERLVALQEMKQLRNTPRMGKAPSLCKGTDQSYGLVGGRIVKRSTW